MQVAIDNFTRITGYDIAILLVRVGDFFTTKKQDIFNYYSGIDTIAKTKSFDEMHNLLREMDTIMQLYHIHRNLFKTTADWDLLDVMETLKVKLLTTKNLNKYLRSSKTQGSYKKVPQMEYSTTQGESLEDVARNQMNSEDYDNDWVHIALDNNLLEEDYDSTGGRKVRLQQNIKLNFKGSPNVYLNSVMDSLTDERMYGLDLNRKTTFVDNDLEVLSYKDTFQQAFNILMNLKKGDIPEFKNIGVDGKIAIGRSNISFLYPVLMRQIKEVFATDDLFTDVVVKEIVRQDDATYMEVEANTVYNKVKNQKINLI